METENFHVELQKYHPKQQSSLPVYAASNEFMLYGGYVPVLFNDQRLLVHIFLIQLSLAFTLFCNFLLHSLQQAGACM